MWDIDVAWDTSHMCSAAADNSVKLWDCETGACLSTIQSQTPARSISLSFSGKFVFFSFSGNMKIILYHNLLVASLFASFILFT